MFSTAQVSSKTLSTSTKRVNHLIALARENCINHADAVNFNAYGNRDGVGLVPVSDYFIDTVMVRRSVPLVSDTDFLSNSTAEVRYFFASRGVPSPNMVNIIPCGIHRGFQQWKIACANVPMDRILQTVKELPNFEVYAIDVTRDFAGSFDLPDLIEHFQNNHGMATGYSSDSSSLFMEKDMVKQSGHTCFVCKRGPIRYKAYLKFPQMLLKGKVREDIGNNWLAWIHNRLGKDCLFMKSRDATCERGWTRIEITVTCNSEGLPSASELKDHLDSFSEKCLPELIYTTPHEAMWRAFADCFQHTLVVVDEGYSKQGLAIIVYALDRDTRDVCGFIVNDWNRCMPQVMARFTLASRLPIDLIRVSLVRKEKTGVETLEICGARYDKVLKDKESDLTYLTNKEGKFSYNAKKDNIQAIGFVSHPNCIPFLPESRYFKKSKVPANIECREEIQVQIPDETHSSSFLAKGDYDKNMPLYLHSTPNLLPPIQCQQLPVMRLSQMARGYYDVYGVLIHGKCYPRMIVAIKDGLYIVYMTKDLQELYAMSGLNTKETTIKESPIARITVRYHRKRQSGGRPVTVVDFKVL